MTRKKDSQDALFQEQCSKAAAAIQEADVLLLVTGAGFSADSGLPVYNDIAHVPAYRKLNLEYCDLCQPHMLGKDPEIFFGFFGQCFNDYRQTRPHKGYDIIRKWGKEKNQNDGVAATIRSRIQEMVESQRPFDSDEVQLETPYQVDDMAGAFHVFTSNCDAHSYDYFGAHEIHDCHGSVEIWQCSSPDCTTSGIWRAPLDHTFIVDINTMRAPQKKDQLIVENETVEDKTSEDDVAHVGHTTGSGKRTNMLQHMPRGKSDDAWHQKSDENWPRCKHCDSLARPAIFMFGDFGWKYDRSQDIRWELWREAMIELCCKEDFKLCVVEAGCGLRIPTCRNLSEECVESLLKQGADATLIRINPDFPLSPEGSFAEMSTIPIKSGALAAIEQIDEVMRNMVGNGPT